MVLIYQLISLQIYPENLQMIYEKGKQQERISKQRYLSANSKGDCLSSIAVKRFIGQRFLFRKIIRFSSGEKVPYVLSNIPSAVCDGCPIVPLVFNKTTHHHFFSGFIGPLNI
jgi:hypothetical protein